MNKEPDYRSKWVDESPQCTHMNIQLPESEHWSMSIFLPLREAEKNPNSEPCLEVVNDIPDGEVGHEPILHMDEDFFMDFAYWLTSRHECLAGRSPREQHIYSSRVENTWHLDGGKIEFTQLSATNYYDIELKVWSYEDNRYVMHIKGRDLEFIVKRIVQWRKTEWSH